MEVKRTEDRGDLASVRTGLCVFIHDPSHHEEGMAMDGALGGRYVSFGCPCRALRSRWLAKGGKNVSIVASTSGGTYPIFQYVPRSGCPSEASDGPSRLQPPPFLVRISERRHLEVHTGRVEFSAVLFSSHRSISSHLIGFTLINSQQYRVQRNTCCLPPSKIRYLG